MTLQEAIAKLAWPTTTTLIAVSEKDDLDGFVVVLAKRERCAFPDAPYVTWEFGQHSGLFSGHYDLTKEQGFADFQKRYEA